MDEPYRLSRNEFHRTQGIRLQFHHSLLKAGVMASDRTLLLVCRPRSGMIWRLRCQDRCLQLGRQCADERHGCLREAEDGSTAEHGGGILTFPKLFMSRLDIVIKHSSSMPQAKIQELLAEPFGPYPDVEILSGALRKGTILNLASLSMECQNAPIGSVLMTLED